MNFQQPRVSADFNMKSRNLWNQSTLIAAQVLCINQWWWVIGFQRSFIFHEKYFRHGIFNGFQRRDCSRTSIFSVGICCCFTSNKSMISSNLFIALVLTAYNYFPSSCAFVSETFPSLIFLFLLLRVLFSKLFNFYLPKYEKCMNKHRASEIK